MITTKTVDLNRFKNAVGFTLMQRCWGNRRTGNISKIKTSENPKQDEETKKQLRLVKELIVSDEYDRITSFQNALRAWIYQRTVPSFFREGFQLTKLDGVEVIEGRMRKAQEELKKLVEDLIEIYPIKIEEARGSLGALFNEQDYPAEESLRGMFSISWNWIAFTVPDGLPAELRKTEQDKLERQFADAGQQIIMALRVAFQELISHAAERLRTEPGEKQKKFRDSVIGNIQAFIDTFNQRNLMNDVELERLVIKAKELMTGMTPQALRDYTDQRKTAQEQFDGIKAQLDAMITQQNARVFEFEEESAAEEQPAEVTP